jgi:hypothetical protein
MASLAKANRGTGKELTNLSTVNSWSLTINCYSTLYSFCITINCFT